MSSLELFGRRSRAVARSSGTLGLCLVVLYGCGGGVTGSPDVAESSDLSPSVVKVPVELIDTAFVPCAGDDGESVELDIREQLVTHESTDSQGRTHVHFVINDKGTTGTGLTTGTRYHQVGATRENGKIVEDPTEVFSFSNNLNLVGQGQAPNLVVHETFHLTINANGVTTVERETQRVECR